MPRILQVHLKRLHSHPRARVILLPGAVQTPDPGEIFEAHGFAGQVRRRGVRGVGDGVDGGAAHGAFEARVGVGAVELGEGLDEPGRWEWLGCVSEFGENGQGKEYWVGLGG